MATPDERKAEYDNWFTPAEVLARHAQSVPWESLVRTVANSLADGLIRATAETLVMPPREPIPYFEISPKAWVSWACLADQDFWSMGTLERFADSPGMRQAGLPHFRAYRVRLERAAVERLTDGVFGPATRLTALAQALDQYQPAHVAAPKGAPEPTKRDQRPKIPRAQLENWVADYGRRNPGTAFAVFRDNARLAFPQFRIGERPVKDAIAKSDFRLKPGNPSIRRK